MDKKRKLLSFENVSFAYENSPVVEDVNITLHQGDFIGVFGPNGGGKSTFLQLIAGLLKPKRGRIIRHCPAKIGYVPQFSKLDKQFPISVLDLVLMGCLSEVSLFGRYSKETKQRAIDALEKVGLAEKKDASFGTLSGGQAQRVLIARAIVGTPEILLLDEPTASIDLRAQEEIHELLSSLNKQGMTIVMVSHDIQAIVQKTEHLLCVHRQVSFWLPQELCSHFALGLYHQPLPV